MDLHRRVLLYQFSWATSQRKVENDKLNPAAPICAKLVNLNILNPILRFIEVIESNRLLKIFISNIRNLIYQTLFNLGNIKKIKDRICQKSVFENFQLDLKNFIVELKKCINRCSI